MTSSLLLETPFLDFSHPSVQDFANKITAKSDREKAVQIYYLVRDSIAYNPYTIKDGLDSLKASYAAKTKKAYCIPKAGLMTTLCRYFGIPSKIGFADVRNHLSDGKMIEWLGTDYFSMHGYSEIWLDDRWIKCTPVFNKELCQLYGVETLEFDGKHDAIFQEFSDNGKRYMEYIVDHGSFDDLPLELILSQFQKHYPHLTDQLRAFTS